MSYRIGIGYDIHRLVKGRRLVIGGVRIPYSKGLFGHSDADVLIHSVCDAILGACGSNDIGELFPDTDPKYKGIESKKILKKASSIIAERGFRINNIDAVIIAQEPTLSAFKKQIRENLAAILDIREDIVNIKAKTNEGMGEIGNKKAIAAYAVAVLITR